MSDAALFDMPALRKAEPHHAGRDTSDVWLTPAWVIDALGGADSFDLDPATPPVQPWPTARRRYTEAENGLLLPWEGRVWLNPPYSRPLYSRFMERMAGHNNGIALIFARTETKDFFANVWEVSTGLLFLKGRLSFCRADGKPGTGNSGAPSVLCAYGRHDADVLAFADLEGQFVPLRLPGVFALGALEKSWREVVSAWLQRQGGEVSLADIYRAFGHHPKARRNPNWRAKIRQVLQQGAGDRVDRGVWRAA